MERGKLPSPGGAVSLTRSSLPPPLLCLPMSVPHFFPFAAGGVYFTQPLLSCEEPVATDTPPAPCMVPPAMHAGWSEGSVPPSLLSPQPCASSDILKPYPPAISRLCPSCSTLCSSKDTLRC